MEQSKTTAIDFLTNDLPELLSGLKADATPLWGIMTPQHMVEHLIVIYKISVGRIKTPVVSKEEDFPKLKAYLMQDSPMRRSVPLPGVSGKLQPLRSASLEEAIDKVTKETSAFLEIIEKQPDFMADHPYGGPMRADEWLHFHKKHIKHHLIQFNLLPDYE